MAETAYIVLRRTESIGEWIEEEHSLVMAASSEAAIRVFCNSAPTSGSGTYVAVPARSWKPVTVRAEQTVTLKIEQAT